MSSTKRTYSTLSKGDIEFNVYLHDKKQKYNPFKPLGPPPFNTVGLFTYLRTYARRHNDNDAKSTVESWDECLQRVVKACNSQLNVGFTEGEMVELFSLLYNLKCSVAGRFLWQLGTSTVNKVGITSLQNCSFVTINEPVTPFTWAMNFLMLGAGVGYRLLPEDLKDIPIVKYVLITRKDTKDADHIVPDSREGWVGLLGKVLKAHFYSGKGFTYSCLLLRSRGAPIKGFGGLASGPEILCEGMEKISNILNKRVGQKMRPIDALDIMNIIGMIVVSGNVRRSAQIALGDCKDKEFLKAKRWDLGGVPNFRCYSNNSVVCNDIKDIIDNDDFWQGYLGNGEPYGLINLDLMRKNGRLGDTKIPDPTVDGTNPCAEIQLSNHETCCLGELYLPNITTKEELIKCATYIYRICKHSLTLDCPDSEKTQQIVHKNMRIGIGVTGYLQATEEQKAWLPECYDYLREFDKKYSIQHGFPRSIRLTTVKPSGCSRGDMLVLTTKGLMRLDEIGDVDGKQWQDIKDLQVYTDTDKTEYVTKFYVNGDVKTKKIITEDGLELESSLNHKYRIVNQLGEYIWKRVDELKIGDKLVTRLGNHPVDIKTPISKIDTKQITNSQIMLQPDYLDTDIARFIGLFYGDGSVHKKGIRISFNKKQPVLLQWLSTFFKNKFGLRNTIDDDHSFCVNSQQFLRWLELNKCLKDHSRELKVPKIIRTSSRENVIAFIDGLRREDGGIHNSGNSWTICTVTETFAQEILVMCRSVGYNVKISCAGGPGGLDIWIIQYRKIDPLKMKNRIWGNFWLDPIKSITSSSCKTYDIEVENAHHYRLGGNISHNTLSLLAGVTSGVHPGYAQYYIRRIRIASESPLIKLAREHGYPVEFVKRFDGTADHTTTVISFPYSLPENTIFANECSAIKQLEYVKRLQTEWSDNSVSVTVTFKPEELPAIKEWLMENYNNSIKSVSFLLYSGHGFVQAPIEPISKEKFDEMTAACRPITSTEGICYTKEDEKFIGESACKSGVCPVR